MNAQEQTQTDFEHRRARAIAAALARILAKLERVEQALDQLERAVQ